MRFLKKYSNFILNESYELYSVNGLNLDESEVSNYYEENITWDEFHSYPMTSLKTALEYVNFTDVSEKEKENYISDNDLENFSEDDFKKFLNSTKEYSTYLHDKWKIILEVAEEDDDEDLEDLKGYDNSEKIGYLDEDDLEDIISNNPKPFYEYMWYDRYDGDGMIYLSEIYGDFWSNDDDDDEDNRHKFDMIESYIDWDKFDTDMSKGVELSVKEDFYKDQIPTNEEIQEKVFEYDNKNAFYLFDMIKEKNKLTTSFKFQDSYFKTKLEDDYYISIDEIIKDEENLDDISELILEINDKYGINENFIKKYDQFAYVIGLDKFNI